MLDCFDHACRLVGPEHVAVGSDLCEDASPTAEAWAAIAPDQPRTKSTLEQTLAKFLSGGLTAKQVAVSLEERQRLAVALTTALAKAGSQFAQSHLRTFSPDAITAAAAVGGGGGGGGTPEARAWKKYVELAGQLNQASIATDMSQSIKEFVMEFLKP